MASVFLYTPHPDDETLSMGLAAVYYLSLGYEVHFVYMSPGGSTSARDKVNNGYNCQFHGHVHNCAQEGYPADLTMDQVGAIRLNEGRSAVGAMGTVSNAGQVIVHQETAFSTYPDFAYFGGHDWQNPINVDVTQAIMKGYIDTHPGSVHHTMSDLDRHPDHACLGPRAARIEERPGVPVVTGRFTILRQPPVLVRSRLPGHRRESRVHLGFVHDQVRPHHRGLHREDGRVLGRSPKPSRPDVLHVEPRRYESRHRRAFSPRSVRVKRPGARFNGGYRQQVASVGGDGWARSPNPPRKSSTN
jgi:LmbE family N-acetylglucosaminyl deacetylase